MNEIEHDYDQNYKKGLNSSFTKACWLLDWQMNMNPFDYAHDARIKVKKDHRGKFPQVSDDNLHKQKRIHG